LNHGVGEINDLRAVGEDITNMKINGYTIPLKEVTVIVIASMWLAGLSFQTSSNAEDIEKLSPTNVRLARIEEKLKDAEEDVAEIKEEQKDQSIILFKILEKVSEL